MQFTAIPTNVITGFLGVGKTTAIQHLLANKPADERWAVLVNEFGEVGIDASMLGETAEDGIFMREVPGGCMCCTAGLPMQMALNQLIQRARPDRLLIEPTGLGHPQEVLQTLNGEAYRDVLQVQATLTLVDARKVTQSEYAEQEIFRQQIAVADCIIAHKADLYQQNELQQLEAYLHNLDCGQLPVYEVSNGQLDIGWLASASGWQPAQAADPHIHGSTAESPDLFAQIADLPEAGFIRKDNRGEGFYSSGWIFQADFEFSYLQVESLLLGIDAERLKAVFITDEGIFAFNKVDGLMSCMDLDEVYDSRIEVIGRDPSQWQNLQEELLAASERL